ncbi:LuxR C-terminal-related transcriptional regulator [Duganella sp. S19_KUP01_CR8]|uniref:LuxR C-terminal-related transcriptional regulator n=1 Tax=Duganella sp. S19_KUP01_CR8 TaxID=3025502 RepID=UPI002FCD7C33
MLDFVEQKLMPPATACRLMPRADVMAGLEAARQHRILLLRAPAGYGKTSMLRLFHSRLAEQGARVAWLTFDSADRDPARLLLSLRAALLGGDERSVLRTTTITHLFLDDVERLDEPAIRLLLSVIAEVLPPPLQVYLGSRSLHQVSVANLKAKHILLEMNLEKLRFVETETEAYLHQANLFLSDEEVRWLHQVTEGWPAAIELLVLAWKRIQGSVAQGLPDLHGLNDLSEYLAEEVLRAQPDDVQAFLIATAPLQSFCVELADAVRGSDDSARLIARIRLSGLPIQPIGEHWFRYHPLFSGHIVRHHQPPRSGAEAIYARAAAWLAGHERSLEAYDCYLKAGDLERAADVLESLAELLRARGQFPSLLRYCAQLPEALLRQRPRISRCLLVGLTYSPLRNDAQRWMDYFRQQAATPGSDPAYGDGLRAFEPVLTFLDGDVASSILLAERNWPAQQQAHPYERGVLATSMAYSYLVQGSLSQAVQMLIEARRICGDSGSVTTMTVVIFLQAYMDAMQGRIDAALEHLSMLDQLHQQHGATIPAALMYTYGGGLLLLLLYERNRIDDVASHVKMARGMAGLILPWDTTSSLLVVQARLTALQSGLPAAKRWLEGEIMKARRHSPPQVRTALENELSRLVVVVGNRPGIAGYAAQMQCAAVATSPWIFCSQEIDGAGIAQARLAIASGQQEQALLLLPRLLDQAEEMGRSWRAAKLRALLALALERSGQSGAALAQLVRALEQGAQSGLFRTFLDEGDALLDLLKKLHVQAPQLLSAAARAHLAALLACATAPAAGKPLAATLTPAERGLLTLVAQGQSNRQVALNLDLSINTVKWHLAQIFDKLGVSNRVQAANLARQAGLLSEPVSPARAPAPR